MMKAIVIVEPGGPEKLALREVSAPQPGDSEVQIAVAATALNRADLLQRRGKYPPPAGESEIMGLECAGVVAKVGPGVTSLREGDRVMALLAGGGYAERVVIHERMAIRVPDNLDLEEAGAIPEAFLTAREALFTLGGLQPGQRVLVHAAAGGVGSAAIQLAREAGAEIYATAGSSEKRALAEELGARRAIDYKSEDFAGLVKEETQGRGVDVVLDFIGGSYWDKHATCLATGGRCVVIGVLGGAKAEVNLGRLLMKRQQILGLVMRTRSLDDKIAISQRFIRESLPLLKQGRLRPVIDSKFPLARAHEAHERMEQNSNLGKILLTMADCG